MSVNHFILLAGRKLTRTFNRVGKRGFTFGANLKVRKYSNGIRKIMISVPRREWAGVEKLIGKSLLVTLEIIEE